MSHCDPPPPPAATSYARLAPRQARATLALAALVAGLLVAVSVASDADRRSRTPPGQGDVALYRAEIEQIHAGEVYYDAAAAELTARGYPTRSVFNWRTPLPMGLIGRMPAIVLGQALLGLLALGLLLAGFEATARDNPGRIGRPLGTALLLTGPLMFCVLADLFAMPVLWAGVLIGLSVAAFGLERPYWGVALGVAAVFFRELALPYAVASAGMAAFAGRRRELLLWTLGLTAWAVFFAWHIAEVMPRIAPDARAHAQSWLQLGGAEFVLATARMNAYLLLLPGWATALYLTAALLGLAGWSTPWGMRCGLTVCLFVGLFAFVGQEFNQYWGCLFGPLLCFGVARFPASLCELWHAAAFSMGPSRAVAG